MRNEKKINWLLFVCSPVLALIDKVFVSTEDTEITKLAKRLKAATPSLRPAKLASDGSKTIDTLSHLVAENLLSKNDCVLLLQPTTPLRTLDNLDVACKLLFDNWKTADAVISVNTIDGAHPYKAQKIKEGKLEPFIQGLDS